MEVRSWNDQSEENGDAIGDHSYTDTRQNNDGNDNGSYVVSPTIAACRFNESLIGAVSGFPCLYDTDDASYKEHMIKEQAWKTVAQQINWSVSECKRRWRNLRDVYCRNRKKVEATKQPTSSWYYYNILHTFLHNKVKVNVLIHSVDPSYELMQEPAAGDDPESTLQTSTTDTSSNHQDSSRKMKSKQSRIQKRTAGNILFKRGRPPKIRLPEPARPPPVQTSSLLWAQSIGMRLDRLSMFQQAQFRIKVETLLMETEMQGEDFHTGAMTMSHVDEEDCKANILKVHVQ